MITFNGITADDARPLNGTTGADTLNCGDVPDWFLAAAFVVTPAVWTLRRRSSRRPVPGLRPRCGYDLRATPAGPEAGSALLDRCPECGTRAAGAARKAAT